MEPLAPSKIVAQVVVVALLFIMAVFRPTPRLRLLAFGMISMIVYGILQDTITTRLSIGYFTIAHPRVWESDEPLLHALAWGFLGGWPAGLGLGLTLSLTATLGNWPTMGIGQLVRPVFYLLFGMGVVVTVTGIAAWMIYGQLGSELRSIDPTIPLTEHRGFFTVACAHYAAYMSGIIGNVILAYYIVGTRVQLARFYASPTERLN